MAKSVVVGASSGLGRCIGVGLAQTGDRVAFLARRRDRLERATVEAGEGAVAVACDVTNEASVRSAVSEAADVLGGIDNLVYSPAICSVTRLMDTDAETWGQVFATNVIGAAVATAAAVPHLTASAGKVIYLSSDAGTFSPAWPGLATYGVSKAALERLIEAWRVEHPGIGFTNLIVGECAGGEGESVTSISNGWDRDLVREFYPQWIARGLMPGQLMPIEDLVEVVRTILRTDTATSMPVVVARGAPAKSSPAGA